VFRLNTRGQFFVAREAYRHLNAGGRIVLMSSNTAKEFIVPKHSVYSGSKGAIESFIPVLALDCGKKKITVNGVAPGGTVTDMFHAVAKNYIPNSENMSIDELKNVSVPEEFTKRLLALTNVMQMAAHASPLVRCGYPIDVAHVVCFLASKEAEWINGKVLGIDGGCP
jgi:tetrahydroxynaphthalene reductase